MAKGLLSDVADTIRTANEVFPETAKQSDVLLSLAPKAINAKLLNAKLGMLYSDYVFEATKIILAKKLAKLSEGQIVEPDMYIAAPLLQNLSFCLDNEGLREMYANLLATAMNANEKHKVHPAFTDIIRQLSSADVLFFNECAQNPIGNLFTVCQIVKDKTADNTGNTYNKAFITTSRLKSYSYLCDYFHVSPFSNVSIEESTKVINNLNRLGLIKIFEDKMVAATHLYDTYIDAFSDSYILSMCSDAGDKFVELAKGQLPPYYYLIGSSFAFTAFGEAFLAVTVGGA
jgi:hypothetical protein